MMLMQRDPSAIRKLEDLGGPALVREMIRLFLEHTPRRIAAARLGEETGDWQTLERACHSMKSSAAYLGLTGLRDRAARLEVLATQGASCELSTLLGDLSDRFSDLRDLLQQSIPPRS